MNRGETLPASNDLELIAHAQQGDRHAFGKLVCLYRDRVVNVVYRMCGDGDLAEEAAQEAFVRAWVNLHRYKADRPFRNWLCRIATNVALDRIRAEKPTTSLEKIQVSDTSNHVEAIVENMEQARKIKYEIMRLPTSIRAVIVLREYEQMSYREIADSLDIPVGTVMSRLSSARNQLRQSLATFLEE